MQEIIDTTLASLLVSVPSGLEASVVRERQRSFCWCVVFVWALVGAGFLARAAEVPHHPAEVPFNGDPDQSRPTLHVQPPALDPSDAVPPASAVASVINGIFFIDVLAAAGFDIATSDLGNEPAIAVNPLDPGKIVITAFSGSNWGSGGNSSLFYSADGGTTWSYTLAVPPPPGTTTNINCPCDQNMDWQRDGLVAATFLHYNSGATIQSVYSAQASAPNSPASWIYRTNLGVAQKTNVAGLLDVDQPWIMTGPLPEDNGRSNACVTYDNFDASFNFEEIRAADSPASTPLDFSRDQALNADGQQFGDGMNPGTRLAIGPDGRIFDIFQRYVADAGSGIKQLDYLMTVSSDGGQTWSVANQDHPSGAKRIVSGALSFQGNGSKIGNVNALLGGVDAIGVDPATGTVWVVYGARLTLTDKDQLWLVPVTYSAGNLTVGTARQISPNAFSSYLPAVAVLPNSEVGVLFMTYTGANFQYRFVQTSNGGMTLSKSTILATFASPFVNSGFSNQRIFGDYLQVKASGCNFYGTYPARGTGLNSASSIDPYFMKAPSFAPCNLPTLTALVPGAVCAGGAGFPLTLQGTNLLAGATARVGGTGRMTSRTSSMQVQAPVLASDIAAPGSVSVELLNAAPAGGLTGTLPLAVEVLPGSPQQSLMVTKGGSSVSLAWNPSAGAARYNVKRCAQTGPCAPATIAMPATNAHSEGTLNDGQSYWYLIEAVNSCGAVP